MTTTTTGEFHDPMLGVVPSISIDNLISMRAAMLERYSKIMDLLEEAREIAQAAHIDLPRLHIDQQYRCRGGMELSGDSARRVDAMEALRRIIDGSAWQWLLQESGLRSLMDAKARADWSKTIVEGQFPALTPANVRDTFQMLHASRADMFERGVIECFRRLSWEYKTNNPTRFGKRLVIRFLTQWGGRHPNHTRTDEMDDLLRVCHLLDGRPEPDHRQGFHRQVAAAIDAGIQVENDYVSVRLFRNGNGHLTFKRLDLVDRMNAIIAKHYPGALPAPR
jgi:hypothetical protein